MALASVILEGATTVSASGGTNVTLVSLGVQGGSNPMIFSTDTLNASRRTIEFSVKPYTTDVSKPGGFTQQRNKVLFKQPKTLANLNRTVNTASFELSVDPETTAAEIEAMIETMAQVIGTAAFRDFYTTQNLS